MKREEDRDLQAIKYGTVALQSSARANVRKMAEENADRCTLRACVLELRESYLAKRIEIQQFLRRIFPTKHVGADEFHLLEA